MRASHLTILLATLLVAGSLACQQASEGDDEAAADDTTALEEGVGTETDIRPRETTYSLVVNNPMPHAMNVTATLPDGSQIQMGTVPASSEGTFVVTGAAGESVSVVATDEGDTHSPSGTVTLPADETTVRWTIEYDGNSGLTDNGGAASGGAAAATPPAPASSENVPVGGTATAPMLPIELGYYVSTKAPCNTVSRRVAVWRFDGTGFHILNDGEWGFAPGYWQIGRVEREPDGGYKVTWANPEMDPSAEELWFFIISPTSFDWAIQDGERLRHCAPESVSPRFRR